MLTRERKFRFSQRAVDELPPHDPDSPSTEAEYCDHEVTGLHLLVGKKGKKHYVLRYRFRGRKRFARIGEHGVLTVLEARKRANALKRQILDGIDPAEVREAERRIPTFADFANGSYLDHSKANKKSWKNDEWNIRLYLAPRFGRLRLDELRTQDIQRFHDQNRHKMKPATANRIFTLLHHMLELAIQWGLIEKNSAHGIKKHIENNARQRYLSRDELRRLGEALDVFPNRVAAAYFRFLLFTGVRKNEAANARWEYVDLENGRWWIPDTKAGTGRWVTLSDAAVDLLRSIASKPGNPYVFPGDIPGKPWGNAQEAFQKIKKTAELVDLRIHDLRHSFASMAVNGGASLYVVQKLLGHSQPATTMRYAHLAEDTLRGVSDSVAATVIEARETKPRAESSRAAG